MARKRARHSYKVAHPDLAILVRSITRDAPLREAADGSGVSEHTIARMRRGIHVSPPMLLSLSYGYQADLDALLLAGGHPEASLLWWRNREPKTEDAPEPDRRRDLLPLTESYRFLRPDQQDYVRESFSAAIAYSHSLPPQES